MALLALDLGGTKLAIALFSPDGEVKTKLTIALNGRTGKLVGEMIRHEILQLLDTAFVQAIGVAVPGIYTAMNGTVWAPNIPGWDEYPLLQEVESISGGVPVVIDSDRACYISGEIWQGNAKGCSDAIFLAVGTGIGAGIVSGNAIIRGAQDIAGAVGWMALHPPYKSKYDACGCFESQASGEGIRKVFIEKSIDHISAGQVHRLSTFDVFEKFDNNDPRAVDTIKDCIQYWGMAVANLVSIFNPQKIIFGGGVFGPARKFIPQIREEAAKWAQPISMKHVELTESSLGNDAGLFGAAYLAHKAIALKKMNDAL
jgi:glucokinase